MKKIMCLLLIISSFLPCIIFADDDLISGAKSGLLMDVETGEILYEKNIDDQLAIASMTKMMGQILILDAVKTGNISWDKLVKVSKNAADFGGSQIYLQAGEVMSVRDLMKGVSVASANDAIVALAEEISGSEEEFVKRMNEKAKELGLMNTNFVNSTGLDEDNHYSSAKDLAIIARYLLVNYPEILEFSSIYEDYLRQNTPNKFWLVNTNKLVKLYSGADGLKTGHTDNAKYCMAVTAKRGDMRLLAVVLGEDSASIRNEETTDLLDYGFNNYHSKIIKTKDDIIDEITINKAIPKDVTIVLKKDIKVLLKKGNNEPRYDFDLKLNEIKLPVKVGDSVGKLFLMDNGLKIGEYDVTVKHDVNKAGFIYTWKNIIFGLIGIEI